MDSMESVTLELRPRLCVVNAYIRYNTSTESTQVTVKLVDNCVILQTNGKVVRLLLEPVKIVPLTISSLMITSSWISFRIQTDSSDCQFGSFRAEILNSQQNDEERCTTASSVELPEKKRPMTFHCTNCGAPVSKSIQFERVLPLPRNDCDPAEWFCCSHNKGALPNLSLAPRDTDYFYGPYYFVLHKSALAAELKCSDSVRCYRCFSILGEKQGAESVKMWNSLIEKRSDSGIVEASKPFDDFILAVKELTGPFVGERILMESSEGGLFKHILLKPMEKSVELLTEVNLEDSTADTVKLEKKRVMKVMYNYGESDKSTEEEYKDVKYCRVESGVLAVGLDHLSSASNRFPPNYRVVNDWYMGFIILPEMTRFFR